MPEREKRRCGRRPPTHYPQSTGALSPCRVPVQDVTLAVSRVFSRVRFPWLRATLPPGYASLNKPDLPAYTQARSTLRVQGGGRWCGGGAARPRIEQGGCSTRLERRKDKAERLRGLTERLRTTEPPLPRLQQRPVLGAYVQRTIPFRSASFSQVDCSPDGKYVRSRAAAQTTKAQREEELQRDRKNAVHSPPRAEDLRSITEEEEKPKNGPSSSWYLRRDEPSSPEEEIPRPQLVTQSSEERDEGRSSPYSDSERTYAKRPLRGPYGMMLEAEMNKGREVHHQRTTSSPSQLEGCARPSPQLLAHLLKGSSERSLSQPSNNALHPKGRLSAKVIAAGDCEHDDGHVKACQDMYNMNREDSIDQEPPAQQTWDTRTHVVVELYETEKSYVESLQILVMKYLQPLKCAEVCQLDGGLVDEIFYQVPAILAHHEIFLEELRKRIDNWDLNQRIGDLFLETFTKPSVIETYTEFITNWKNAKEAIKNTCQAKPVFARFLDNMAREHKGKLDLDSLLIMPVQRIPRYELLIQSLLKHTESCHSDVRALTEALRTVHELAVVINVGGGGGLGSRAGAELVQLEALIDGLAGLQAPDRQFLSHDLVTITTAQGRKDRAFFLFTDLLVITSIKRKSTTIRKPSQPCPGSIISTLEGNKYKLLMKISLHDLDIVKAKDDSVGKMLKEMEQLSADAATLSQMAELVATLHCPHSQLEDSVREMLAAVNRQLADRHSHDSHLSFLELTITTRNGVETVAVSFSKPEKRTSWEEMFTDAKQRLGVTGDRRRCPELVCAVPIRKTRAGLQFTCAAPTCAGPSYPGSTCGGPTCRVSLKAGSGLNGPPEVWVCNSDGYVGQVCVLSLSPEPTVTSCNGVCNARILCIAPVPGQSTTSTDAVQGGCNSSGISISVEDTAKLPSDIHLDSSSSSDEEEEAEKEIVETEVTAGTMWLGTEDGCIHVYNTNDNIRTKKNKIRIQHGSPVHAIIYLENRVFVSLGNGDITVYFRDHNGGWNTNDALTIPVGVPGIPVTKMVPIAGKLWCTCHTAIKILNLTNYLIEHSFVVSPDGGRAVSCIAAAGLSVWISLNNSATVKLFHASTYDWITEVNVAPSVTKMLASCDDIIRQHKAACLRVTALLACKDLLWVGTSAGVILTVPLPQIPPSPAKHNTTTLSASGVAQGHTGQVRFLTTVESSAQRRGLLKSKLLVISGGDGYEDFRSSTVSEVAGREDSTNHLLLWQI